jgi:hypothetical protein
MAFCSGSQHRFSIEIAILSCALLPIATHAQTEIIAPVGVMYFEKLRAIVIGGLPNGCQANVYFTEINGTNLLGPVTLTVGAGYSAFVEYAGVTSGQGRVEILPRVLSSDDTGRRVNCLSAADVIDLNTNVTQVHYNESQVLTPASVFSFGPMTLHPGDLKHLRLKATGSFVTPCNAMLTFVDNNNAIVASKNVSVPSNLYGAYLELIGLALTGTSDIYRPKAVITSGACVFSVDYWDPQNGKTLATQGPILGDVAVP